MTASEKAKEIVNRLINDTVLYRQSDEYYKRIISVHLSWAAELKVHLQSLIDEIEGMKKEGWVLVPKEPTHEMLTEGLCSEMQDSRYDECEVIYKAMLKAARPEDK